MHGQPDDHTYMHAQPGDHNRFMCRAMKHLTNFKSRGVHFEQQTSDLYKFETKLQIVLSSLMARSTMR